MKGHKHGIHSRWTGIGGHKCPCCAPANVDKPKERRLVRRKLKDKDRKDYEKEP